MASKRRIRRLAAEAGHLSDFYRKQHGCRNKTRFTSMEEAQEALDSLKRCRYFDGRPMNTYLCPITLDHYHIGHIIGINGRRRRSK